MSLFLEMYGDDGECRNRGFVRLPSEGVLGLMDLISFDNKNLAGAIHVGFAFSDLCIEGGGA